MCYMQWCRQGGACGLICTQSMHLSIHPMHVLFTYSLSQYARFTTLSQPHIMYVSLHNIRRLSTWNSTTLLLVLQCPVYYSTLLLDLCIHPPVQLLSIICTHYNLQTPLVMCIMPMGYTLGRFRQMYHRNMGYFREGWVGRVIRT